ncbi:MAG: helix-turn-helix domain-containing protein, partial [Christensenellaceae bacterium]
IRASSEWDELDDELKRAALLRMEYPEMSYRELAEKLSITKSSLSRRLKHLSSIAKRITKKRL